MSGPGWPWLAVVEPLLHGQAQGSGVVRAAAPAPFGHMTLDRALVTGVLHCKMETGKRAGVVHRAELSPLTLCGTRDLCFMTND